MIHSIFLNQMNLRIRFDASGMKLFKRQFKDFIAERAKERVQEMVAALSEATPLDTGLARSKWAYRQPSCEKFVIINSVEYIKYLNAGTSKQAPAFFVEKTAMRFGKPRGVIVTYSK